MGSVLERCSGVIVGLGVLSNMGLSSDGGGPLVGMFGGMVPELFGVILAAKGGATFEVDTSP